MPGTALTEAGFPYGRHPPNGSNCNEPGKIPNPVDRWDGNRGIGIGVFFRLQASCSLVPEFSRDLEVWLFLHGRWACRENGSAKDCQAFRGRSAGDL